jgi:hypothetical protein
MCRGHTKMVDRMFTGQRLDYVFDNNADLVPFLTLGALAGKQVKGSDSD